jgi:hypothetical protein
MSKRYLISHQVFSIICGVTVPIAATILSFSSSREVTGVSQTISLTYPHRKKPSGQSVTDDGFPFSRIWCFYYGLASPFLGASVTDFETRSSYSPLGPSKVGGKSSYVEQKQNETTNRKKFIVVK